jgi:hypothetical protein
MPRRIQRVTLEDTTGQQRPADAYFDRVVKYVPADVVGAWVAVTTLLKKAAGVPVETVLWVCFAVGIVVTAIWTWRQTKTKNQAAPPIQILISTLAFVVWVFALGDPFASLSFYNRVYGSLALIGFTLISGAIIPAE